MSKKTDRAAHGPSWTEVILGAALSLILGVVLGAVLLIVKPTAQVKELPKEEERARGTVYYIEGARDASKAKQALAKRKSFVEGQSVSATEEEINSLITPATPASAPPTKAGDKKAPDKKGSEKATEPAAPPVTDGMLAIGQPNVRIRQSVLQLSAPVTLNVFGAEQKVVVQARGKFEKRGDLFVYQPDEMYLGSLPMQRLPFLSGYVRDKVLEAQAIPEDVATAWRKLASVTIEDKTLKLAMP